MRAGRRPPWPVVAVALAVALLSLAVAAAALVLGDREAQRADDVRAEALAAARERTAALTTYDHRTLEADFEAVLRTATGEFEREYERTTAELRETFVRTQAVATGEVVAAGLERVDVDAEEAVAVVAVDQVIRTAGAAPRTERNRLRMELVKPGGTWLVQRVERL